jgi:hypothetical protein
MRHFGARRIAMKARGVSTVVSLLGVAASLLFTPMQARADPPIQYRNYEFTGTETLTDWCAFPVEFTGTVRGHGRDFLDKNGHIFRGSYTNHEQDTFSANGRILIGEPYTYHLEAVFDANGNLTSVVGTGITEKIRLPDGSLFVGAGWYVRPGAGVYLVPDKGNPGNMAAFCAALAP